MLLQLGIKVLRAQRGFRQFLFFSSELHRPNPKGQTDKLAPGKKHLELSAQEVKRPLCEKQRVVPCHLCGNFPTSRKDRLTTWGDIFNENGYLVVSWQSQPPPPSLTSISASHADTWWAESLQRRLYVDESLSATVSHTGNILSPAWVGNLRSGTREGTSRHSSSMIWCSTVSPHIMNCRKIWLHMLITIPQLVWRSHKSLQLPFLE